MSMALLLVPDFSLILLGLLISRVTDWGREFWTGLEKLVYYVLFPALLFSSIARTTIDVRSAAPALAAVALVVAAGIAAAALMRLLFRTEPRRFASAFQTAFRFNSYIGLAIAGRLHGEAGIAAFGIIIGLVVPLCNVASVWALARHHEAGFWAELVRNPLILATVGGVLFSLLGIPLPDVAHLLISRMGSASLACGLLCVGAALTMTRARHDAGLIGAFTAIKLLLMPALAVVLVATLAISGIYREMVILLAALPTATSAYVLAVRMGGDGALVAQCVTISTLCGMITLPLWMMLAR